MLLIMNRRVTPNQKLRPRSLHSSWTNCKKKRLSRRIHGDSGAFHACSTIFNKKYLLANCLRNNRGNWIQNKL